MKERPYGRDDGFDRRRTEFWVEREGKNSVTSAFGYGEDAVDVTEGTIGRLTVNRNWVVDECLYTGISEMKL